jgi:hypothetical protein
MDKESVKELALLIPKGANVGMGAGKFGQLITLIIDHTDEILEVCPHLDTHLYIKEKNYCPLINESRAGQAQSLQRIRAELWRAYYKL